MYNTVEELLEVVTSTELLDARLASQLEMLEEGKSGEEIRVGEE